MKKLIINLTLLVITFLFVSCGNENEPVVNQQVDEAYTGKYRPQIHFSSKYNWINDPNGLVYFDGEYHLFFQHNPYGSNWGFMSWGHAVSTDLIHWTQFNVVMRPDGLGDIFSGSIVIDKDNTAGFGENAMIAIYTSAGSKQTQSIAFSTDKGRTFVKYRDNPVLQNPDIPDFRDPKVFWHNQTNKWIMSLATGQTVTFYSSNNLKEWTKLSDFGNNIGAHNGVWECPDLFPLPFEGKTKWVLLVSVGSGASNGGSGTQYFIGDFDGKTFTADQLIYPLWLDYGKDNYAGITWDNIPEADGRKIQIAWMNNWEYAGDIPTYSTGSNASRSGMTLPRELTLTKNNQGLVYLKNKVISEINNIASEWKSLSNETMETSKSFSMEMGNDKAYHLQIKSTLTKEQILTCSLLNATGDTCVAQMNNVRERIYFHRNKSGNVSFSSKFANSSFAPFVYTSNEITFDLYVDQSSVELFANDGEITFTNQVFPKSIYDQLKIQINAGSAPLMIKYRTLKSIWK